MAMGRNEDVQRAIKDEGYREKLMEELGLE